MNKSLGQKLVGISFNPSSLSTVDEAMRRIMDAQMWAVKAITWKD